jgi:hypothetical protein
MTRCLGVLAVSIVIGTLAVPAHAWYPSTPQVEFGTATW